MLKTIALAAMLATAAGGTAQAGCAHGTKNLGGSLGPGQTDSSRSFTVNDSALLRVRVQTGGPLTAELGCGRGTSNSHACQRYGYGEQFVTL